ncbi:hypothetical protein [Campylobacter lari]|uniref:hypothetical protein n=1 Tax=Campylobacter lari TaxID=201 RepID=UPI00057F4166|nr:hypothetical protein [Campylobacter lari]AJD05796.1 hypothetical protein UPTC16712_0251 [Campylobacter lari RM16712]EAL5740505.1 hypothetical protein [Campylobacter lari]EGK8096892.1 hypothetical protein [Campylobacter lari]MCR6518826.1 hypothetical protein [Campylobacter lari]MCR6528924.1 hypothetical protein [Campylobacter lari]
MRIVIFMLFLSVMYADNCNNEQNNYVVAILEYKITMQNLDQQEQIDLDRVHNNILRNNIKSPIDLMQERLSDSYNAFEYRNKILEEDNSVIRDIINMQDEVRNFYNRQRLIALEKLNLSKLKLQRCKNKK